MTAITADLGRPRRHAPRRGVPWGWRFSFPDEGVTVLSDPSGEGVPGPELWLPQRRDVRVELTSNDVIHAFWVPDFLFKRDAIPGRVNVFDVTPTTTGTYHGVCSEFCGLNHAFMTFTVKVVPADAFDRWLGEQATATGRGPPREPGADASRGAGRLAHHHRPQEDRHPLLRHGVRVLPDRRHARRRDARPSSPRPAVSS